MFRRAAFNKIAGMTAALGSQPAQPRPLLKRPWQAAMGAGSSAREFGGREFARLNAAAFDGDLASKAKPMQLH